MKTNMQLIDLITILDDYDLIVDQIDTNEEEISFNDGVGNKYKLNFKEIEDENFLQSWLED